MKLIFVNRFFYPDHSATSQLLSCLTTALAARGWNVNVITSRLRYDAPDAELPAWDDVRGVRVHRVWTTRFGRVGLVGRALDYLSFYISAAWRLWRITRRDDVIVAKTDPPIISVVAAVLALIRGARLINWLQDVFPEVAQALQVRGMQGATGRVLHSLRNWSLRRAQANVVLSKQMRAKIETARVDGDRVHVFANWESGQTIWPVARAANELRHEWGLANKFVVGYSGNMGRAHDFAVVLDAAERLKSHTEIVFLWIGDGAQCSWLRQEASRRRLTNFMFKPYQPRERLAESLSVPDVHLLSLRPILEGLVFPSKFYGITAAGRSILFIGDPSGDVAAELQEHRCGSIVSPTDSDALFSRIEALSSDMETCQQMGERARQAFVDIYDERFAIERWEGLLQKVARRRVFIELPHVTRNMHRRA